MKKPDKKKVMTARRSSVPANHPLAGSWLDPEKKMVVSARYDHPFIGTWQEARNSVSESSAVYTIAVVDRRFVVSGIDESDGTSFKVSNVRWDGRRLQFTSLFPPTGHLAKHVFQALSPGRVRHAVTYTDIEIWQKRRPRRRERA